MLEELASFFNYMAEALHLVGRPHIEFMQFFVLMITIFSAVIGVAALVLLAIYVW